jgi:hypothetical protein
VIANGGELSQAGSLLQHYLQSLATALTGPAPGTPSHEVLHAA